MGRSSGKILHFVQDDKLVQDDKHIKSGSVFFSYGEVRAPFPTVGFILVPLFTTNEHTGAFEGFVRGGWNVGGYADLVYFSPVRGMKMGDG